MPSFLRKLAPVPVAVAYFAAASLSVAFTRYDGGVAYLWIATSILIAELSLRPRREWKNRIIACGAASALATSLFGLGWAVSVPLAIANMAEALIGGRFCAGGLGAGRRAARSSGCCASSCHSGSLLLRSVPC